MMNFSKHGRMGDPVSVSTASRRASQSRIGASRSASVGYFVGL